MGNDFAVALASYGMVAVALGLGTVIEVVKLGTVPAGWGGISAALAQSVTEAALCNYTQVAVEPIIDYFYRKPVPVR